MEALIIDSFRGWESTGIAVVSLGSEKDKAPDVFKKALWGGDFVQLKKVDKLLSDMDKASMVIGHNRASTRGSVNDKNAHPFQYDHITLAHNGTINNFSLLKVEPGVPVDSAHVALAMAEYGEKETLEKLIGGFALVWHNSKDGTLNIARNDSKPLVWCYEEGQNTMYWMSELEMLGALLVRNGAKMDGKFRIPAPFLHYKFNISNLREYEKLPFVDASKQSTRGHYRRPSAWEQEDVRQREASKAKIGQTTRSTSENSNNGTDLSSKAREKHEEELNKVFCSVESKIRNESRVTGRPTSAKRIKRANQELAKLHLVMDGALCIIPDEFIPYKNQQGIRGSITGCLSQKPHIKAQINQIMTASWPSHRARNKVYARIVNVQYVNDIPVVVCVEHERVKEAMARRALPDNIETTIHKHQPTLDRHEPEDQSLSTQEDQEDRETRGFVLCGPKQTRVSLGRFTELTQDGCCNCTGPIGTHFHERVLWVGEYGNNPLCIDCQSNPGIMTDLGLYTTHSEKLEQIH